MKSHELTTEKKTDRKRVGRGISSGSGKTAGKGTKGQNARAGGKRRPGFEGGQTPIMQRVPKLKGFRPRPNTQEVVYTGSLNSFKTSDTIDNQKLADAKIISSPFISVKLILKGDVDKKLNISLQKTSAGAIEEVAKKGGSFKKIDTPVRPATKK